MFFSYILFTKFLAVQIGLSSILVKLLVIPFWNFTYLVKYYKKEINYFEKPPDQLLLIILYIILSIIYYIYIKILTLFLNASMAILTLTEL